MGRDLPTCVPLQAAHNNTNQPTQMDTKGYLGVPRPDDQKPDQKSS